MHQGCGAGRGAPGRLPHSAPRPRRDPPQSPIPTQVPLPWVPLPTEASTPQASPSLQGLSPHPISFLPLFLRGICSQMAQARPSPETLHPDSEPALRWAALLSPLVTG